MHDDYKQLDLSQFASAPPNGRVLDPCPLCNSPAQLWQYSESETTPRKLLVMCSHGDRIGPQDGLMNEGCPFYMPPNGHYRETIRDAVRYWNELARAIVALRTASGVMGTPAPHPQTMTSDERYEHGGKQIEQMLRAAASGVTASHHPVVGDQTPMPSDKTPGG